MSVITEFRYFAVEGIVGVGKSVQTERLKNRLQMVFPDNEVLSTKEPGGTEIAEEIRSVVLRTTFDEDMTPKAEQFLYAASRAQSLPKVVQPVLDRGGFVVTDRCAYASLAFQGFGRGLGVEVVLDINRQAVDDLWPHAAFFINTDIDLALSRCHDKYGDKFESMGPDFFEKCIEGYRYIVKNFPHVYEIDGNGTVEEVHEQIWTIASGLLGLK